VFFSAWDIVGADDGWSRLTIGIPGGGKFNIFYSTIELGATTHKKGGLLWNPTETAALSDWYPQFMRKT